MFATSNGEKREEVRRATLRANKYRARAAENLRLADSAMIKDEYRKQWTKVIKKPMNFFKHADNDPEEALEFSPLGSIGFIMGAASGLRFLGEQTSHTVGAFTIWLVVNKPNWITPKFRKLCEERVGIDELQEFKLVPKCDFLGFSFAQAMRPARSL